MIVNRNPSPAVAREYLRVSHDKTGHMRSPEEQHEANERAAAAEGWTLGTPYLEDGAVSASRYSRRARPGFSALLADLQAGQFGASALMLWEPSRGSRRMSEWVRLVELLGERGIVVHVTSHGRTYDPRNARDRRSLHEDGTDSEYESAKLSERIGRALASRAAHGEPHSRAPYGYRREYVITGSGRRQMAGQVPDPDTAPVVRRIYDEIRQGMTLRSIAARLNSEGVPAPGGGLWKGRHLRSMVLNPAYAGLRLHDPRREYWRNPGGAELSALTTAASWPPLVALETWHGVRTLLTDPRRRTARPGRDKHLLSMIAECGACGSLLTVRYVSGRDAIYTCRDKGHVRIPKAELDELAETLIRGRLAMPDAVIAPDVTAEAQAARDELAAIRAHHSEMTGLLSQRKLSAAAFAAAEPGVLADIDAAEKRVRELEAPPALRELLAHGWDDAPMAAKREITRLLVERISVQRTPSQRHKIDAEKRTEFTWKTNASPQVSDPLTSR